MIEANTLKILFEKYNSTLEYNLQQLDKELVTNIFRYNPSSLVCGKFYIHQCSDGFVVIIRPLQNRSQKPEIVNSATKTISELYSTINDEMSKYHHVGLGLNTKGFKVGSINLPQQEFQIVWINSPPLRTLTPYISKLWLITPGCEMQHIETIVNTDIKDAIGSINLKTKNNAINIATEFLELIDSDPLEEEVQKYLNIHPYIIEPSFVASIIKPKISDLYVADYAFTIKEHNALDWLFVEIEKPNKPIFTKNDQFTSQYTQAKGQLLHWKQHLLKNPAYFRANKFKGMERPKFILIYGRNSELNETRRGLLKDEWSQSDMSFITYDDLMGKFNITFNNFNFNSKQDD